MTCPSVFKCLDFEFKVEVCRMWGSQVGLSKADTQEIRIAEDISDPLKRIAVLHELLHCLSYIFGLGLSESQITRLGGMLPTYVREYGKPFSERILSECIGTVDTKFKLRLGSAKPVLVESLLSLAVKSPQTAAWIFGIQHD
jgi:hypothetical protein